jgi:hypothetical protein
MGSSGCFPDVPKLQVCRQGKGRVKFVALLRVLRYPADDVSQYLATENGEQVGTTINDWWSLYDTEHRNYAKKAVTDMW